jgi:hypothetical protein
MLPRPQQPAPSAAAPPQQREVWELKEVAVEPARLSLHLEIQGLQDELHRSLQDWIGKVIELPALKIRIKDDDLG